MPGPYRLYGADLSPYSIKVRNFLRFKGIEHQWISRSAARQAEFARFARLPLVPILVGSDDFAVQDSTPIIDRLEAQNPEPAVRIDDAALQFLAVLLEDYADEWVNKAMFHYRWTYPADQLSAATRLVAMIYEGIAPPEGAVEAIRERMSSRLHHVGSSAQTAPIIEASFERLLGLLETHLTSRRYLFGGRPSVADFSLAGQLGQLLSDPTPGAIMSARAPNTVAWVARMDAAAIEGDFESFESLWPTLKPIVSEEVSGVYLVWSAANFAASKTETPVEVSLPGGVFAQAAQKYAAKALTDLRRKRAAVLDNAMLAAALSEAGGEAVLALPAREQPAEGRTEDASGDGESDLDDDGSDPAGTPAAAVE